MKRSHSLRVVCLGLAAVCAGCYDPDFAPDLAESAPDSRSADCEIWDLNEDGAVDFGDFLILSSQFGETYDFADFLAFSNAFESCDAEEELHYGLVLTEADVENGSLPSLRQALENHGEVLSDAEWEALHIDGDPAVMGLSSPYAHESGILTMSEDEEWDLEDATWDAAGTEDSWEMAELRRFEAVVEQGMYNPNSPMMAAAARAYRSVARGDTAPSNYANQVSSEFWADQPEGVNCAMECGLAWRGTHQRPRAGFTDTKAEGAPHDAGHCAGSAHAMWPGAEVSCSFRLSDDDEGQGAAEGNAGALIGRADADNVQTQGCDVDVDYWVNCTMAQRYPGACSDASVQIEGHETADIKIQTEASRDSYGYDNTAHSRAIGKVSLKTFEGEGTTIDLDSDVTVNESGPNNPFEGLKCNYVLSATGTISYTSPPNAGVTGGISCTLPVFAPTNDDTSQDSPFDLAGKSDTTRVTWGGGDLQSRIEKRTRGKNWRFAYFINTDRLNTKHVDAGIHTHAESGPGWYDPDPYDPKALGFPVTAGASASATIEKARGSVVLEKVVASDPLDSSISVRKAGSNLTVACDDPLLIKPLDTVIIELP